MWDVKETTATLIWDIKEHRKAVTCFSLFEPGNCLLSGSTDKTIRVNNVHFNNDKLLLFNWMDIRNLGLLFTDLANGPRETGVH